MAEAIATGSDAIFLKRKFNCHDEFNSKQEFEPVHLKNPCLEDVSLTAAPSIKIKTALRSTIEGVVDKHASKRVRFDAVDVYLFERSQGFTCIPSQGGSTLGMTSSHWTSYHFSTAEHLALQTKRRLHHFWRQHCAKKIVLPAHVLARLELFFGKEHHRLDRDASVEDVDSAIVEEEEIEMEGLEEFYFVQPVSIRQRRTMLRQAGIAQIDADERVDCQVIRASREHCGCQCVSACLPDSCLCALEGISCQVDRLNFPCACARQSCANPMGRSEFNPVRVRTHYAHTQLRLTTSPTAQLLNSTEKGACKDCQDDKYLALLKMSDHDGRSVVAATPAPAHQQAQMSLSSCSSSTKVLVEIQKTVADDNVACDHGDDERYEDDDDDDDEETDLEDGQFFSKNNSIATSNLEMCHSSAYHIQHHVSLNNESSLVYKLEPINTLLNNSNHVHHHVQPPNCMPLGWPPVTLPAAMITSCHQYPSQHTIVEQQHQMMTVPSPFIEKVELTDLTPLQSVDRSQLLSNYYTVSNTVIPIKPVPVMVACAEELKRFIPTNTVAIKTSQCIDALSVAVPSASFDSNHSDGSGGNISPSFGEILKKSICETSVSA